jgi:hypothetical protein
MIYNEPEKYCVRINCNNNVGSGVLLAGETTFYVFTAAHCLGKEEPKIEDISIEKQKDYKSEFENIKVVAIKEFDYDKDFALIEIDFRGEDKLLYKYDIAHRFITPTEVKFCGYQGINNNEYRPFPSRIVTTSDTNHCFKIKLTEGETFQQGGEDGCLLARGLSGSGVFIIRHNTPFLIGILNSVVTDKAWNNDINCCSVHHIQSYFNTYVDLSDFETLRGWEKNINRIRTIEEIEAFKSTDSDFFKKLYRKNEVLYPDIERRDEITVDQITSYLSMKENIDKYSKQYPDLFSEFKTKVSKLVSQVKQQYSLSVDKSNEAIVSQRELQNELKSILDFMHSTTTIDMSEYQIIEWLGMCTLNFTKND